MRYYKALLLSPTRQMRNLFSLFRQSGFKLPAPLDFAGFVLRRFWRDRCPEVAGSLTFTTMLALVPFLTIALTVASAFPTFEIFSNRFKTFLLTNLVPDSAGRVITVYMKQFTDNADKLTVMGTAALGITALAMLITIDETFNRIWRVSRSRRLVTRALTYWATLTLAPLLIGVSISLTSWLFAESGLNAGWFASFLLESGTILLAIIAFALLYGVVPNCPVPMPHAMSGAIFAGILFELMKKLFGWYVRQFSGFKLVYGAFASLPIFLMWLYLSWMIVLAGAVLTAALSYWQGGAWRKPVLPGRRVRDAVRALLELDNARLTGEALTEYVLQRRLAMGLDELHGLLEQLAEKQWVQATRNSGWVLSISLESLTLREVYATLVPHPQPDDQPVDRIASELDRHFSKVDAELNVTLAELKAGARLC
ncbi:YihY family inner membrane protein [Parachitinimonas caeni]|uniref:UPF0761 membrane protein PZA18_04140 n=1 Tax=Parachitinimonas caeni TaxID=3031301 RepID=A0ABT7DT45_9NEIS|nr:YihY family inner membrane protein [Parachitinimonas caeni]MDK2123238.1 YihY family inner membrane protein [Parachitinimonas caeni]